MKSQKFLIFIALASLLTGGAQCLRLIISQTYINSLFLFIGLAWLNWAIFAFAYDKDMPGVGPFSFNGGKNQISRVWLLILGEFKDEVQL